jgi:fucose permease
VTPRELRAARGGVSLLFLVNGALLATLLPRLPLLKASLGLTNAELGAAIAAMPVGGLVAGGLAGVVIHRLGSGRVAVGCGVVAALLLPAVALVPAWAGLVLVFLVLGMFDATMDAAMNAHGIGVERGYGRSILQGFHGLWSAGTLLGGLAGALAAALDVPLLTHLAVSGAVLALVALVAGRGLLPDAVADAPKPGEVDEPLALARVPRLLLALLPVAVLGMLGVALEDAAQTWSTIFLVDGLGLAAGAAAGAFVVYTASMTVGRLLNDRWIDRLGPVRVARAGGLLAAAALSLVVASGFAGSPALAVAGFALLGLGASPVFPVMITSAGNRPGVRTAHGVALVAWLVRAGFVVAPALVGIAADRVGLGVAFVIPLAAAVAIAVATPALLRPPARRPPVAGTPGSP